MPFSKNDCINMPIHVPNMKSCVTFENEALLPNLATSQVFSSLDKIKDYETRIKNNYQENNLSNRPLPEESDYFYDEYVDYPYNETILENMNDEANKTDKSNNHFGNIPKVSAPIKNATNTKTGIALKVPVPTSGFTFFGVPLPSIDMGKLLNTGRKIDWSDNRNNQQNAKKYQVTEPPKFETGGFSPMLPTTSHGFMPIVNPTISHSMVGNEVSLTKSNIEKFGQSVLAVDNSPPNRTIQNSTTHKKTKSEIHELEAYHGDDNSTHIAYNRTKNVEEQNSDPINIKKYNLMESNMTITQATEKEGIITTDTSNDMSLQGWLDTSSTTETPKPLIKKHIETQSSQRQPTALSAILLPTHEDLAKNHSRAATITKVNMPHAEHYDLHSNFAPVINREGKTRFSEGIDTDSTYTKTKRIDDHEWYYKNYNKTNLDPYVAPGIQTSCSCKIISNFNAIVLLVKLYLVM
ncbi:jg9905 [Pararge aegeria aegeria]|uniref:Jg9905 protein n=1 Tax=Pararge aegeria aegeria TaxID=348720 RepID=A0A8S4RE50_9NEOP|nr:jg9905 [Pararge aegeria aegeria]